MNQPSDSEEVVDLNVPEMDCDSCAGKVRKSLENQHISECSANPATGKVTVRYDSDNISEDRIIHLVGESGYDVVNEDLTQSVLRSPRGVRTALSGVFAFLGLLFEFVISNSDLIIFETIQVSTILYLSSILIGGSIIFKSGYNSLKTRSLDIDLLVTTSVIGAVTAGVVFGESLFFEAAMLSFLFNVAEILESYSINKARSSLEDLMNISPEEAVVKREGEELSIPIENVEIGETVIVRPGGRIPLDGVVSEGESAVNESPITGESFPVDKNEGDEVFAGSINEEGYLEVEVTRESEDTTISQIVRTVEEAQKGRTEKEKFVEKFSHYYTPTVVILGIMLAVVPPLFFSMSWVTYILYGLTLFVLACPCALVISTPVSIVSGVTEAANNGILVKSGSKMEFAGNIDTVAMDKTGTITKGELEVTDIIPLNDNSRQQVLECAYGIESKSEHPISQAIAEEASDENLQLQEPRQFESMTGKGVKAELHGDQHYAGKLSLFKGEGFNLTHIHSTTDNGFITDRTKEICQRNNCLDLVEDIVPDLQSQGKTVVLVGTSEEIEGLIAVKDQIRPTAKEAINQLKERGVNKVVMLTGDNEKVAESVAEEVGVDEYYSVLLPEEKADKVEELKDDGRNVAMVGDGVNDAPSMVASDISIAMGVSGTDIALETADVALIEDDLLKLPYFYDLSRKTSRVVKQNILASIGVKAALVIAVPFGLVPVWVAVLIGDAGMTVGVTANAMRISNQD